MTFTIVARSEDGQFTGTAMATSSPAVGNRCAFVAANGAVAFQCVAEPRLGSLGLRLLQLGYSADKVVRELLDTDDASPLRQIGIVDEDGRAAAFTGERNMDWCGHRIGQGYVAMGNIISSQHVVDAIAEEYEASSSLVFEDRLVRAIEAGRDAGGQEEGQTSASILTYGRDSYSRCDLRVDVHEEPIGELRRVYDWYAPLVPYFEERARNPEIGRYKDFLKRHGHERKFGERPPILRSAS